MAALLLIASCGPRVKRPAGAPERMSKRAFVQALQKSALDFESLRYRGKGHYRSPEQNVSFKFDLRIYADSLVWLSLGDPVLGITLARGRLDKKKLAYYNDLDKTYFEGQPGEVADIGALVQNFGLLQDLLAANIPAEAQDFSLGYRPGAYTLTKPDSTAALKSLEFSIDPVFFRPRSIEAVIGPAQDSVIVVYRNYAPGDQPYPEKILMGLKAKDNIEVELDINRMERNRNFPVNFKIPRNYEMLR